MTWCAFFSDKFQFYHFSLRSYEIKWKKKTGNVDYTHPTLLFQKKKLLDGFACILSFHNKIVFVAQGYTNRVSTKWAYDEDINMQIIILISVVQS